MTTNRNITITSNKCETFHTSPISKKTSWKHPRDMGIYPTEEQMRAPSTPTPSGKDEEFQVKKMEVKVETKQPKGNNIIKFGYISKLGEVWKNWKTRYFVLFDDGTLEYYANVPKPKYAEDYANLLNAEYKGGLNVGLSRFRIAKGVKKGDLCLELELNQRHFTISFETKEEMISWKKSFEQQGCEFYDLLIPSTKSVLEMKQQKKKITSNNIKRDYKGRAVELAIEEQKIQKMVQESSKSFVQDKVITTAPTELYANSDDLGALPEEEEEQQQQDEYDPNQEYQNEQDNLQELEQE